MAFVEEGVNAFGDDRTGANCIGGNAVRSELLGKLDRKGLHGAFGGRVGCAGKQRPIASGFRTHVDDASVAGLLHMWDDRSRGPDTCRDVDIQNAGPILIRLLEKPEGDVQRAADIVDKDVETVFPIDDTLDGGLDGLAVEHVDDIGRDREPVVDCSLPQSRETRFVAVPNRNARSFAGQTFSACGSQAAARGGDQGRSPLVSVHLKSFRHALFSNIVIGGWASGSVMTSIKTVWSAARASSRAGPISAARSTRMPVRPHARAIAAWSTGSKNTASVCMPNRIVSACFW